MRRAWLALVVLLPVAAPAAESWVVGFDTLGTFKLPFAVATIKYHGQVTLTAAADGKLTGTGTITGTDWTPLPVGSDVGSTPATGGGSFNAVGELKGDYLRLGFNHADIVLSGIVFGAHSQPEKYELHLDPATLADPDVLLIVLPRELGAASKHTATIPNGKLSTIFRIESGFRADAPPETSGPGFPDKPNLWTLELKSTSKDVIDTNFAKSTTTTELAGSLQFPLPWRDGPARGEGQFSYTAVSDTVAPMANHAVMRGSGKLILDGVIEGDVLRFEPRALLTEWIVDSPQGPEKLEVTDGIWFFQGNPPVEMQVENHAEVVLPINSPQAGAASTGEVVWRLEGVKKQQWQVRIDGWDFLFRGAGTEVFGLDVHWCFDMLIDVEDGQLAGGTGRTELVSMTGRSEPPGVWTCTPAKADEQGNATPYIKYPTFTPGGTLNGQILSLKLPENYYAVAWRVVIDRAIAKKFGITAVLNSPDTFLADESRLLPFYTMPTSSGTNFGPITLQDGWTAYGSQIGDAQTAYLVKRVH